MGMAAALPAEYHDLFPAHFLSGLDSVDNNGSTEDKNQTTSDLGYQAALQLIHHKGISVSDIGILLFVSRTYDYRGPITAAILQHRLQIPTDCIAFDIPHGATALVSGLLLAASQLKACNKSLALVIVGDTTDKLVPDKKIGNIPTRNAAAAFLLAKGTEEDYIEGELETFSDFYADMIFPGGGFRLKEMGTVEKRQYGSNFEDPARLLIKEDSVRHFILHKVPQWWNASVMATNLVAEGTDDILLQVNDLNLVTINTQTAANETFRTLSNRGSFGAATLPLFLDMNRRGIAVPFTATVLYSGEGFSVGIFKCKISEDAVVPTVFTSAGFEGAWTAFDY